MQATPLEVTRLGLSAVRVVVPDARAAAVLAEWVREAGIEAEEVVPAAATVVLDGVADLEAAMRRLHELSAAGDAAPAGPASQAPVVDLPVTYDGADLEDVARRWGLDVADVPARLAGLDLVAAFCGFAPGFAYLEGLPEAWSVPRLSSPRTTVPAGSVAVADRWIGTYPSASPGGWRLLGRTTATLFDVRREAPALLPPGTRVRLVPA